MMEKLRMFFINKTQNQKERHAVMRAIRKKRSVGGFMPSPESAFIKRENPNRAFYRISG
jgi:hypothetical protein